MSTLTLYAFNHPGEVRVLDMIRDARTVFPDEHAHKIGVFLNMTGILNKDAPDFENDTTIIAQHSGIEIAPNENRSRQAWFKIDETGLEEKHPDVLQRFQDGVKDMHGVRLLTFSKEQIERFQTVAADIYASYPKPAPPPLWKRGLNSAYRLLTS